ncbi:MAG: hypothetical protein HYV97_17735 [Bdellovibrio sp.]|nr:hypothetical protein [Bdellovibrio sp.]
MDVKVETFQHSEVALGAQKLAYAQAERRMRLGRRLVVIGFVVSILGVIAYCVGCFNVTLNQEIGGVLYDNPGWLLTPTLGTMGLGTVLWLIGSFIHLKGAMDSDPEGPMV